MKKIHFLYIAIAAIAVSYLLWKFRILPGSSLCFPEKYDNYFGLTTYDYGVIGKWAGILFILFSGIYVLIMRKSIKKVK